MTALGEAILDYLADGEWRTGADISKAVNACKRKTRANLQGAEVAGLVERTATAEGWKFRLRDIV